jgi:hypothetical protein
MCRIYFQVVLLGWSLNTSEIVFIQRFRKWILIIVLTLFLYRTRSHSTLNCMYRWGNPALNHDQASSGVRPIAVRGVVYQFTSHVICFQFCDVFASHFSPHQFKIATKGGCETIIHGIKCILNLHLD